ncbi:hypothetical protein ACFQ0B_57425 [Nonomuraea thailandensis]
MSAVTAPPQCGHVTTGVNRSPHECTSSAGGPPGGVAQRSPQAISVIRAGTMSRPASVSTYS